MKLTKQDWENKYASHDTPWDLSGPTPEFSRIAQEGFFHGRVIVPGGGRGHDAIMLAQHGAEVSLVDFAPTALRESLVIASKYKLNLHMFQWDFFQLPFSAYHKNSYDFFLEYTFFCAIDPSDRKKYVQTAYDLLKPKGKLVGLFFPTIIHKEGPPFQVCREEVEEIFSPLFQIKISEPKESIKPRRGREFFIIAEKKDSPIPHG